MKSSLENLEGHSHKLKPMESSIFHARRGTLPHAEIGTLDSLTDIPFEVKRVFYIYDTLEGVVRGNHSNLKSQFALVCLHASCRVRVRRSAHPEQDKIFLLDQPYKVLLLSELAWKEMYDFTPGSVLLCLSSEVYDPREYIRKFNQFLELTDRLAIGESF